MTTDSDEGALRDEIYSKIASRVIGGFPQAIESWYSGLNKNAKDAIGTYDTERLGEIMGCCVHDAFYD